MCPSACSFFKKVTRAVEPRVLEGRTHARSRTPTAARGDAGKNARGSHHWIEDVPSTTAQGRSGNMFVGVAPRPPAAVEERKSPRRTCSTRLVSRTTQDPPSPSSRTCERGDAPSMYSGPRRPLPPLVVDDDRHVRRDLFVLEGGDLRAKGRTPGRQRRRRTCPPDRAASRPATRLRERGRSIPSAVPRLPARPRPRPHRALPPRPTLAALFPAAIDMFAAPTNTPLPPRSSALRSRDVDA